MDLDNVTVFGGTGFIGRYVVKHLAGQHIRVRVATRDPERAFFLRPMGDVGQISPMAANFRHEGSIRRALEGADGAVISVGTLYQRGNRNFQVLHAAGPARVARLAREMGVKRLVLVSAIGADAESGSAYARSKAAGEQAVREAFPEAAIVRPSVVFGAEDQFFNRFGLLATVAPVLPLIGGGETRFQPVYVGDVAEAVARLLLAPEAQAGVWELGGPRVYTFKEILELVMAETGRRRLLVPLPFALASFKAAFLQFLPSPPLTPDQVELLKRDNVAAEGAKGLADLGIAPVAAEAIVPTYLHRYRRAGRLVPSRLG